MRSAERRRNLVSERNAFDQQAQKPGTEPIVGVVNG
jgi:hypothetical protein